MLLGIPQLDKLISSLKQTRLDDFVDRCNYYYTVLGLLFAALLIGSKQHFGEPIRCLVDQQYAASWVAYVHDFCFISNRYSFETVTTDNEDYTARARSYENYYQWIPYLLAAEAFAFFAPHFFWKTFQSSSGFDMLLGVDDAVRIRGLVGEERKAAIATLASYVDMYLNARRRLMGSRGMCDGTFSALLYITSKLLNVANIYLQLRIVNYFIGDGDVFWGLQLTKDLVEGRDWKSTGHFPRVILCNYERIELGNTQSKTVQCALSINILNEKVFVLLSVWLWLLLFMTIVNAITTCFSLFIPPLRKRFVKLFIEEVDDVGGKNAVIAAIGLNPYSTPRSTLGGFHVSPDVALFFRFVGSHAGAITARDIARAVVDSFHRSDALTHCSLRPSSLIVRGSPKDEFMLDKGVDGFLKRDPSRVKDSLSPSQKHKHANTGAHNESMGTLSIFADRTGELASSDTSDSGEQKNDFADSNSNKSSPNCDRLKSSDRMRDLTLRY